jgi:hypothetical protein
LNGSTRAALYKHLVRVVQMMKEGRAVVMIHEDEALYDQGYC